MYPVPAECPVCHSDLLVTALVCPHCETEIRNQFEMDALSRLIPAQRHFVEVFLLCEGKLNCVQEELGISYPTVRSRLDEIIQALNRKTIATPTPMPSPMPMPTPMPTPTPAPTAQQIIDRQEVLSRLAEKEISAEEALELLGNL